MIEAAAMNVRAKEMGYDATKTFEERLSQLISQNEGEGMNPVALQLGPISIRWYAICIVSGFDTSRLSFHERSAP